MAASFTVFMKAEHKKCTQNGHIWIIDLIFWQQSISPLPGADALLPPFGYTTPLTATYVHNRSLHSGGPSSRGLGGLLSRKRRYFKAQHYSCPYCFPQIRHRRDCCV